MDAADITNSRHTRDEIAKFDRLAAEWWDPNGPMAPLHAMQPVRLDYLRDQICGWAGRAPDAARPLEGLRLVDLGCGAGLIAEPMARLGASVTGVDASAELIAVARRHADRMELEIDYRCAEIEAWADAAPDFDIALAIEVIEHVEDVGAFLQAGARRLRLGGLFVATTLNRTARSWLAAIAVAEYALRWLPIGAHDWRRFAPPETLAAQMSDAGLDVVDRTGFVYAPISRRWRRDARDLSVNYAMTAEKRDD